ncbi:MAG: hypothetical protein K2K93_06000, partial [Muribaculaceae bacterium]|nr:hypothetical protein [Muribaculaceae bacterium]
VDGYAHLNLVALAGISTDFYRDYHRNYSWGAGYSVKAGINWALTSDKLSVKISNQFYNVFTKNNFDAESNWMFRPDATNIEIEGGDNGVTTFNHLGAEINYRLIKNLYLSAGTDLYVRNTKYKDMYLRVLHNNQYYLDIRNPKWNSKQLGAHLMLTYKF